MTGVLMLANECAKEGENYAKAYRPWTDRTGHARQRLTGHIEQSGKDIVKICVSHGVDYGESLEYEHEERYAILRPTINALKNKWLQKFETLLNYMR